MTESKNVLVLGGGGREHAICWALKKSPLLGKLYCMPGNAGIAQQAIIPSFSMTDGQAIIEFCQTYEIDIVIIGGETLIADGISDQLRKANIVCLAPSQAAGQLESSKIFTKTLCQDYHIPTAEWQIFEDLATSLAWLDEYQGAWPIVIKKDGLAAGKGVVIAADKEHAINALQMMFANAGERDRIVIEQFLDGYEVSLFILADGQDMCVLGTAQDYKRLYDGQEGLNTGGMGAYSPVSHFSPILQQKALKNIIEPTLRAMQEKEMPYQGILYAGLMVCGEDIYLLEYNVRFGDPECQVIMPRLKNDWLEVFWQCAQGQLLELSPLEWHNNTAITVVMASPGYPNAPEIGHRISNLDIATDEHSVIFHAATQKDNNGCYKSSGGRVLNITSWADNLQEARGIAYEIIEQIDWPQAHYRRDIGL